MELLVLLLHGLTTELDALRLAACLGNTFQTDTLLPLLSKFGADPQVS